LAALLPDPGASEPRSKKTPMKLRIMLAGVRATAALMAWVEAALTSAMGG
jgi:hypothetical protein